MASTDLLGELGALSERLYRQRWSGGTTPALADTGKHQAISQPPLPRDQNLRRIRRVGRQRWKHEAGYHRRSWAETAVFRDKIIFGNTLMARTLPRQMTEARLKVAALHRMTQLGLPDSHPVA